MAVSRSKWQARRALGGSLTEDMRLKRTSVWMMSASIVLSLPPTTFGSKKSGKPNPKTKVPVQLLLLEKSSYVPTPEVCVTLGLRENSVTELRSG